jgi:hypothetical protein
MCSHVPNKGEQMVRYYGYYSNACRGKRKAKGEDDLNQDPGFPHRLVCIAREVSLSLAGTLLLWDVSLPTIYNMLLPFSH